VKPGSYQRTEYHRELSRLNNLGKKRSVESNEKDAKQIYVLE